MRFGPVLAAGLMLSLAAWQPLDVTAPMRYRIDLKVSQVVDLTALGQSQQTTTNRMSAYIQLALSDTAGAQLLAVTLDSIVADSSPLPKAVYDSLRGATWRGTRDARGKVVDWNGSAEGPFAEQIGTTLRDVLPRVPRGTKAGAKWTDTLDNTGEIPGGSLSTPQVTNYESGNDKWEGKPALKVMAASSSSTNGTQQSAQGQLDIQGTGTGTGTYYLGNDFTLLGSSLSATQKLQLSGAFAPEPIPVTVTLESTTSIIK